MTVQNTSEDDVDWTAEMEVNLFHAMKGHKPTGINRHFHMACIHHKLLSQELDKDYVKSLHVWKHLKRMYNLDILNELNELPFPNHIVDFQLPEEITNPEMMSAPVSPATSVEDGSAPPRPTNLNLASIKTASLIPTPDALISPKRKRNARGAQIGSSQPSSPAAATPGTGKRRR